MTRRRVRDGLTPAAREALERFGDEFRGFTAGYSEPATWGAGEGKIAAWARSVGKLAVTRGVLVTLTTADARDLEQRSTTRPTVPRLFTSRRAVDYPWSVIALEGKP